MGKETSFTGEELAGTGGKLEDGKANCETCKFLPENVFLAVLVWALVAALPAMCLVTSFIFFQGLTLLITGVMYVIWIPAIAWRVRKCSHPIRVLMMYYSIFCTAFLVVIMVDFTRVVWETNTGGDLVILGRVSEDSLSMNVYGFEKNDFIVEIRSNQASPFTIAAGPVALVASDEYLGSAELTGLVPDTLYEYQVRFNQNTKKGPSGTFKTMPVQASASKIVFASSSCSQRNRYVGSTALEGFTRISEAAQSLGGLNFMLFLGDFIYTDVPWSLGTKVFGYGVNEKLYHHDYRGTLNDGHLKTFARNTPTFFMYDDHEIVDNYKDGNDTAVFQVALDMFDHYLGVGFDPDFDVSNTGYQYNFTAGDAAFFVVDTRFNRDQSKGIIIGASQLAEIKQWLLDHNTSTTSFLVSPVGYSRNQDTPTEGWNCGCPNCEKLTASNAAQCPNELEELVAFIDTNNIENVVLISGDTHKPGVFDLGNGLIEVSASPINAISDPKWDNNIDKTLYEEDQITTAFAIYELDFAQNKLTIRVYAGGIWILEQYLFIVFLCMAVIWFPLLTTYRYYKLGPTPILSNNLFAVPISILLIVAIIVIPSVSMTTAHVDKDFEAPSFEHVIQF